MSESTKELSEMVAKLCSLVDQESVHVPAGFLRKLETELQVLRGSQSEERREAAMTSAHRLSQDLAEANTRLSICRSELGKSREELVEQKARMSAEIAELEAELASLRPAEATKP